MEFSASHKTKPVMCAQKNHYKIGILSGKKSYSPQDIRDFVTAVNALNPKDVAWKKSLLDYVYKL